LKPLVFLTTVNAKYIHTGLALYALRSYCRQELPQLPAEIRVEEFHINQEPGWVFGQIYKRQPKVAAFSVNIWNFQVTLELVDRLKKVAPETIIVLGGPEVSAGTRELLQKEAAVDYVVRGEGEETFCELLHFLLQAGGSPDGILGLAFREGTEIRINPPRPPLKEWPFPYNREELAAARNRLVYYESSRGCAFNCAYCLTGWEKNPVRYLPVERVKADLTRFIEAGNTIVKLVDRTFNLDRERAMELLEFMAKQGKNTLFHLELVGELMDREVVEFFQQAPAGRFHLEIGVQSTCRQAVRAVNRFYHPRRLAENLQGLRAGGKVQIHLDLLAGLPGENLETFAESFNWTYRLRPDELQLGFLKLLQGSPLREKAGEYGYLFSRTPPYEILGNKWLTYRDLHRLKIIEEVLGIFFNSRRFRYTLDFLLAKELCSPWEFYNGLAIFWERWGYSGKKMKTNLFFKLFREYLKLVPEFRPYLRVLQGFLTFDFYLAGAEGPEPHWLQPPPAALAGQFRELLAAPGEEYRRILPEPFSGFSRNELRRRTRIVQLAVDPVTMAEQEVFLLVHRPAQGKPFWRRWPGARRASLPGALRGISPGTSSGRTQGTLPGTPQTASPEAPQGAPPEVP
jgi:radical SAM superfamily enzyme YgiQ (UPF0313 family)